MFTVNISVVKLVTMNTLTNWEKWSRTSNTVIQCRLVIIQICKRKKYAKNLFLGLFVVKLSKKWRLLKLYYGVIKRKRSPLFSYLHLNLQLFGRLVLQQNKISRYKRLVMFASGLTLKMSFHWSVWLTGVTDISSACLLEKCFSATKREPESFVLLPTERSP